MDRPNHLDNFGTNLTTGTSASDTTSPVDSVPSIAAPFWVAFDATNINGHYERKLITSKTATNILHSALSFDHTTAEEVRIVNPAEEFDAIYQVPRGYMINGKLSVTDAAGITVALKTLAGADPSETDPVFVRIGDTTYTITSALSRVLADGTNWFNSGSAELATKEVDYFAYLVWDSNSSAVGLTFARIPSANLISDFSATTTNEKYCAGQSDFTSTDEVEVIGRFAATLSAGAGYTWSVPTYTAINLIQRPIYETRWLSFTPTYNNTIGNGTNGFDYKVIGNAVHVRQTFAVGSTTTTGSVLNWTIPFTLAANENRYVSGSCRILDNGTAYFLAVPCVVDTTHISWLPHNDVGSGQLTNTRPMTWATGDSLLGQFKFDIA